MARPEEHVEDLESDAVDAASSDESDRVRGGWVDAGTVWDEDGTSDADTASDGDAAEAGSGDAGDPLGEEDSLPERRDAADDGTVREADPEDEGERSTDSGSESTLEGGPTSDSSGERVADHADDGTGSPDDGPVNGPSVPVAAPDGPTLGHGTPDDAVTALRRVLIHRLIEDMAEGDILGVMGGGEDIGCDCNGEEHPAIVLSSDVAEAIRIAIEQRKHFDTAATGVSGLNKLPYPHRSVSWDAGDRKIEDYMPTPALLGRPTLLARRVFEANARTKIDADRKSGRVNARVLGRRAPQGDPRLFGKKALPKKHSYAVVIVLDCSGSMGEYKMERIRRYGMAMGEILHRLGVQFSMFGHTAHFQNLDDPSSRQAYQSGLWMYVMPVKEIHEPWNDKAREKLIGLSSVSANLDGHALEYARKEVMRADATDRIIFYFSDGEMPAENEDEEREILEREIPWCRRNGITLLGGGINSEGTRKVGMDTVMLRSQEDITKLIEFLQKNLTRSE